MLQQGTLADAHSSLVPEIRRCTQNESRRPVMRRCTQNDRRRPVILSAAKNLSSLPGITRHMNVDKGLRVSWRCEMMIRLV
jgi:hypothetical protein